MVYSMSSMVLVCMCMSENESSGSTFLISEKKRLLLYLDKSNKAQKLQGLWGFPRHTVFNYTL